MSKQNLVNAHVSSSRFYGVIAEKDGAKFAINCTVTPLTKATSSSSAYNYILIRMVEVMKPTGQQVPEFHAFDFRGEDKHQQDDGVIHFFRGEKYNLPFSTIKDPNEMVKDALENKIPEQVAAWFEHYVGKSDATLSVSLGDVADYVKWEFSKFSKPEGSKLFKLPDLSNIPPYKWAQNQEEGE